MGGFIFSQITIGRKNSFLSWINNRTIIFLSEVLNQKMASFHNCISLLFGGEFVLNDECCHFSFGKSLIFLFFAHFAV